MTVLRMVSLFKRNGSDNWYYRRTIPADVRRILEKATKKVRRRGWYQTHIMISTGTPDRAAAKTAGAEIAANVERTVQSSAGWPEGAQRQTDRRQRNSLDAHGNRSSPPGATVDVSNCAVAYADSIAATGSAIALGREADASSTGATTGASSTHLAPAFFRAAARCKRRMF